MYRCHSVVDATDPEVQATDAGTMVIVKIAKKNQVTVPLSLRAEMHFAPGDVLYGHLDDTRLVLTSKIAAGEQVDYEIQLRDRFQLTLPAKLRQAWVAAPHVLEATVEGGSLVLAPKIVVGPPNVQRVDRLQREVEAIRRPSAIVNPRLERYLRRRKRQVYTRRVTSRAGSQSSISGTAQRNI